MRAFVVDAFTDRPFAGNPAAVCLGTGDDLWMQQMAAEFNLAETAFLAGGPAEYDLRWFTPEVEVDLCGHATLAAAHVLWETGESADVLRFRTRRPRPPRTPAPCWPRSGCPRTGRCTAVGTTSWSR